ncbi:hypothetical protein BGZ75_004535 [Mortierella antarctica]|nr:hypothetical protein BGZ75_004535 [Mortierella antarctica]
METSSHQPVFKKFENYDFEGDATFQNGLKSIVNGNQDKSEREQQEAIQNAKYFYFSRFVQNFDNNQYQAWRAQQPAAPGSTSGPSEATREGNESQHGQICTPDTTHVTAPAPSTTTAGADPSYPKSFQEICELIASGKPIPGIRQIPNNLAEGTPSEAKLAPKLKPWEAKKAVEAPAAAIDIK